MQDTDVVGAVDSNGQGGVPTCRLLSIEPVERSWTRSPGPAGLRPGGAFPASRGVDRLEDSVILDLPAGGHHPRTPRRGAPAGAMAARRRGPMDTPGKVMKQGRRASSLGVIASVNGRVEPTSRRKETHI